MSRKERRRLSWLLREDDRLHPLGVERFRYAQAHPPGDDSPGETATRADARLPFVPPDHHVELFFRLRATR